MDEIVIPILGDLLDDLSAGFYSVESAKRSRLNAKWNSLPEFTVARVNGLSIEIRLKEHPPPHFHVTYKDEDACYSIIDCNRLPGTVGLEGFDGIIRNWWENHQQFLIEKWNKSRPTDCPVGPIKLRDTAVHPSRAATQ